jgi:tight adherence protein C
MGIFSSLDDFSHYIPYVLMLLASTFAVFGIAILLAPDDRARRLAGGFIRRDNGNVSIRRSGSALERFVTRPFTARFAPSDERERSSLKLWLLQAGYDSPQAIQTYYGFRVCFAIALTPIAVVGSSAFLPRSGIGLYFALTIVAALIGFMFPVYWVRHRRKVRQQQVSEGLPDVLDLLLVCTEAGLGLDTAIARVGEEMTKAQPVLSSLLMLVSAELLAGRPRAEAMRNLSVRANVDRVTSLVNLLLQSDQLGSSMAATLRVFAADMRSHQLLNAEEAAQKMTVKLSMVLVICFMPALMIAVMAPVIFHIVHTWKGISI